MENFHIVQLIEQYLDLSRQVYQDYNLISVEPCYFAVLQYQDLKNIVIQNTKYKLLRDLDFFS